LYLKVYHFCIIISLNSDIKIMKNILQYITHPILERIKFLKDAHKGENCYLFKENNELLKVKFLDVLATFPNYGIY